jgi:hypothetical protein
LLADVLRLPQGVVVHTPAYKLSPAVNEASSSEGGRARNTRDGDRRWSARTFFIEDCANVTLNCDHIHQHVLELAEIAEHTAAGHTEVVVRPAQSAVT